MSYGLRLPHDARAAGIARTTLRSVLVRHDVTHHADTAELLAVELVANAYRHTDGPCELRLSERTSGRLRISVWDTSPVVPAPFDKPPTAHDHAAAIADAGPGTGFSDVMSGRRRSRASAYDACPDRPGSRVKR